MKAIDRFTKAYLQIISEDYDESFDVEKAVEQAVEKEKQFLDETFEKDPDLDDVWVKTIAEPDVKLKVKRLNPGGYKMTILNGEMQISSIRGASLTESFSQLNNATESYIEDILSGMRKTYFKKYIVPVDNLDEQFSGYLPED